MAKQYDRSAEDLGNIVGLEHVNLLIPDQGLATLFYVSGLGLTRDPYLMTSVDNMWINVGKSQFHLPTGKAQRLRGRTALVIPDRELLLKRLANMKKPLEGTQFSFKEHKDHVTAICPWGNEFVVYEPSNDFAGMVLGMPYVEFDVPPGSAEGIARFYRALLDATGAVAEDEHGRHARISVGAGQDLIYRESDAPPAAYDGHHIQLYIRDFSGPHRRLMERGLITEESDQHQYRFEQLVDPDSGKALFTIEHEIRSMRHPLYNRPLVNRNPEQTNRNYAPGHDGAAWSMAHRD
jgi:hypothetical protein